MGNTVLSSDWEDHKDKKHTPEEYTELEKKFNFLRKLELHVLDTSDIETHTQISEMLQLLVKKMRTYYLTEFHSYCEENCENMYSDKDCDCDFCVFLNTLGFYDYSVENMLSKLTIDYKPKEGWIRFVRNSLGISSELLFSRIKRRNSNCNIKKIEESEIAGTISINKLSHIAWGMNCKFVYAIIPTGEVKPHIIRTGKDYRIESVS